MSDLPEPPIGSHVDLSDFPFMPVDVRRLLTSETWLMGTGDEKAAAMTLWLESWHQVPAGSLPSHDRMLAHLSQAGTRWKKVKDAALRGWVKCSDGRLYHRVVCEKAMESWSKKTSYRERTEAARAAKEAKRLTAQGLLHDAPVRNDNSVTETATGPVTAFKGEGEGEGEGQGQGDKKKEPSAVADSSRGGDQPCADERGAKAETAGGDEVRKAYEAYNATAQRLGLPLARDLTDERRKKLRARLRASGGLPVWLEALERIGASAFLTGRTERGFRADLDFLCQAKSFQRLIEGYYADKAGQTNGGNGQAPPIEDEKRWRERLVLARRHKVWSTPEWGPWPTEANCRVPLHLLEPGDGEGWTEFDGDRR